MLILKFVILLLFAIIVSNLINRFLPSISVPLVQIGLGGIIGLLPLEYKFEMEPALFLTLFIAPLIFNSSMLLDKRSFWKLKFPIINLAFLLVFATVFGVGYLTHLLVPAIPLTFAFLLIASLAPTDDVAVLSLANRLNVPPKIKDIISGESIINDASGIISFQFALLVILGGTFSVQQAIVDFLLVAIGGVIIGLLLTLIKYIAVKKIRSLGMENTTFHILIEILTPFFVYMIAEALHVSGILAIFTAGIAHSFSRRKFNPDNAELNIASESTWNMLSFALEGMVFLILGTQLPDIFKGLQNNSFPISTKEIIGCIAFITLIFVVSRFIWTYLTISPKAYNDPKHKISKVRACVIFSLSGARGAVTLAIVMSIPLMLSDGTAFPLRDLIITIAAGVIICSLLITNFMLPLVVKQESGKAVNKEEEDQAYLEILHDVVKQLSAMTTNENKQAVHIITREYISRISNIRNKQVISTSQKKKEQEYQSQILNWEKENIQKMYDRKEIDEKTRLYCEYFVEKKHSRRIKNHLNPVKFIKTLFESLSYSIKYKTWKENKAIRRKRMMVIQKHNDKFILDKLRQLKETDSEPLIDKFINHYELMLSIHKSIGGVWRKSERNSVDEYASIAFQIERDNIQKIFENGRISRQTAAKMRNNLLVLENQLREGYQVN